MKLTVTLNTKTEEFNDIEITVSNVPSLNQIIVEACKEASLAPNEVTSYVIVGSTGN